eukprot:TRINITY_DN4502_c0_g1_i1.p2 TRINITY_DN4502_c0_g1~~TRINITY_DN4502_c0_g1_i1.p2  ORF type:complete len:54 (+),score=6.08 TRINITY_DN4502_c0_g1_i1:263-424(+)
MFLSGSSSEAILTPRSSTQTNREVHWYMSGLIKSRFEVSKLSLKKKLSLKRGF